MRNKKNPKQHQPQTPPSHAQLQSFIQDLSLPPPWVAQGDGEWGLQSIHNSSSLPLLPPHTFPHSSTGPLHGYSAWSTSSPPLTLVFTLQFLTIFFPLTSSACAVFCPFSNLFFVRWHHLAWGAQTCPAVGPLELAGSSCVQHRGVPGLTEATPAAQTLPPVPIIVFLQFTLVESKDCCMYICMECQLPAEPSTAGGMNFQVY